MSKNKYSSFMPLKEDKKELINESLITMIAKETGMKPKELLKTLSKNLGFKRSTSISNEDPLIWAALTADTIEDSKKALKSLATMRGPDTVSNLQKAISKMIKEDKDWELKEDKKEIDDINKDELKGSHADRKDGDIDNDGDTDDSDKFLHKRRKAVSKSIDKIKNTEEE